MILKTNIENDTIKNNNYRKVIYTDNLQQVVLMSLEVGEYIPKEKHNGSQFFRIESGKGIAEIGYSSNNIIRKNLKHGDVLIVPKGVYHYIKNTSNCDKLKLYSIYSPPQHEKNTIDKRQNEF